MDQQEALNATSFSERNDNGVEENRRENENGASTSSPSTDPEPNRDQQDLDNGSADTTVEDFEFVSINDEPTTSTTSPECQNSPENCPICQTSLLPSRTVFYHGALKDYVKDKVSSTDNQNQAAKTKNNSLRCPECEVNFVTLSKVQEGLWRFVNMGIEAFGQLYNTATSILTYFSSILGQNNLTQDVPIVKVYSFNTGETFGAYEALMEKVKNKIPETLVQQVNPKDADAFLVICPITSRIGSDVESAMAFQEVSSADKPVILVLMHHTRDTDYSTAGTKWSEVYKNVTLDVHVLFHETIPGLLNCQQNNQAIEAIEKKLYEYRTFCHSHLNKSSHTPYQHV